MSPSENNKRIAKNTLLLYVRQIVTLFVSLYTVRIVLDVLGVEDYGIYTVVAGVVALFSFLSGTMASASQRFFSYALGQNDAKKLKSTFTTTWIIYAGIAIIAFVLLETIGLWFVNNELNVPPDRFESAKFLYQFSLLTFLAMFLTSPFNAAIIAHEDMQIFAYVSIVDAVLNLVIVFMLVYLPGDSLKTYGVLIFTVAFIKAIVLFIICTRKYDECQFKKIYWDKDLLHEIVGFTGWTLFGAITSVSRVQGVTILLNQFFNPVTVAARAIATSVANQINIFSYNFNIGLYPPIIKAYAAKDKPQLFSLIYNGSKITFFLLWIFGLPIFIEMETILNVWLKNPPPEAVLFSRLALFEVLINSISAPLITAARAPGKMRTYELTLGMIQVLLFISVWIVLKLGGPAYSVYIIAIVANGVMFFMRLVIISNLIGLDIQAFSQRVILPVLSIIIITSVPTVFLQYALPKSLASSFVLGTSSVVISSVCIYFVGLNNHWRDKIRIIVVTKVKKIIS